MEGNIIIFRLPPKTKNTTLSKFCQKLYGQDTSSHHGKYRYHRNGLLDDIPHRKLIRGVLIVKTNDTNAINELLKEFNAEIHIRKIEFIDEDINELL